MHACAGGRSGPKFAANPPTSGCGGPDWSADDSYPGDPDQHRFLKPTADVRGARARECDVRLPAAGAAIGRGPGVGIDVQCPGGRTHGTEQPGFDQCQEQSFTAGEPGLDIHAATGHGHSCPCIYSSGLSQTLRWIQK